jgi:hypothetical protein
VEPKWAENPGLELARYDMQGRAKWTWAIVGAALGAVVSAMGCSGEDGYGACPTDNVIEVQCVWEGGITFVPDRVSQDGGFVFVRGEMTWSPCGSTPGKQIRAYRIDPKDGSTAQMAEPPSAAPFILPAEGKIEVVPVGSNHRVRIDPDAVGSVSNPTLPIGEIVDDATNAVIAPHELAAICDE